MSRIKSFEDLTCWQEARALVQLAYSASAVGELSRDFGTRDQLRRAALSVMNNIAEGFGRDSNKQFIRFLDIAQSSCMEVKSISYVLDDMNWLTSEHIKQLRARTDKIIVLTRGLIKYLRAHPKPATLNSEP